MIQTKPKILLVNTLKAFRYFLPPWGSYLLCASSKRSLFTTMTLMSGQLPPYCTVLAHGGIPRKGAVDWQVSLSLNLASFRLLKSG